jgi:hypothetical protein
MKGHLLISSALVAAAGLCSASDAEARGSFDIALKRECERAVLHARIARVRSRVSVEAGASIETAAGEQRLAQWYNWGDWPNGWENSWKNY